MRLLLDQGLPRGAAPLLRDDNVDAVHVGEINMASADDDVILAYAREEDRIVITLDADFHAILVRTNAATPSVIRIRIEGLKAAAFTNLIRSVLNDFKEDIAGGSMITVRSKRVGVRRLPLTRR